ncbi:MAG: hypothetical protein HN348_26920, partial [Proteobacteria bacterium]|nr:hypothetical protein [Pseudomonadota bacterium]
MARALICLAAVVVVSCVPSSDFRTRGFYSTATSEEAGNGTSEDPFIIDVENGFAYYTDAHDTLDATSNDIDSYGDYVEDASGPEYFYYFVTDQRIEFHASLAYPEASGTDNDIYLLTSTDPTTVIARGGYEISEILEAGEYFLTVDSVIDEAGPYELTVDIRPWTNGTVDDPFLFANGAIPLPFLYEDTRDTSKSESNEIDFYPPWDTIDESGPEYVYAFSIDESVRFYADIVAPEPGGVDVDVHLLDSINPPHAVARGHHKAYSVLEPGDYWLTLDSWGGSSNAGEYTLTIQIRANTIDPDDYFNEYLLAAVDYLDDNYGRLGYDSAVLTHDIEYGDWGTVERSGSARTMCVAAQLEIILTAYEIYAAETGDDSIWDYLPRRSFAYLGANDLKAHIWVNYDIDAGGTADALRHFGMGENIRFEELLPGSFININRTTGTGHAVLFLAYIDDEGNTYDT